MVCSVLKSYQLFHIGTYFNNEHSICMQTCNCPFQINAENYGDAYVFEIKNYNELISRSSILKKDETIIVLKFSTRTENINTVRKNIVYVNNFCPSNLL